MKSVGCILKKIHTVMTTITAFVVIVVAGMCAWEFNKPITDYFIHYGDITTRDAVVFPQPITLYSFGIAQPKAEIDAEAQLYCVSADSISREWVLMGTMYGSFGQDSTLNALPTNIHANPLNEEHDRSDLGVSTRGDLRSLAEAGHTLYTWNLGNMRPRMTSSCYVETTVTTYTEIFKISRELTSRTIEFTYSIPGSF